MAGKGGRIAPDGRTPQASGVGKNAKRHDLERPATPGLANSDLQYGDVQMLSAGQELAPIAKQQQGPAQNLRSTNMPRSARTTANGTGGDAPDPVQFLQNKLRGTLDASREGGEDVRPDLNLLPLMAQLAATPGASGMVASMYINAMASLHNSQQATPRPLIDMGHADERLRRLGL